MSITEQTQLRRVTPEELLQLRELTWRQQVRNVSLAAEMDVKDAHTAQVAQALGAYHRRNGRTPTGDAMFTRWPACVVLAMTGVAASHYVKGTFWPAFAEAIGCTSDQDMQTYWGVGFQTALRQLGLQPFDDLALRHVGPVLMHTGVPTYCFADLLRLLVSRVRLDPHLDADSFLTWVTSQPARMQTLDKPVRRFLTRGTDFALDFIDRCLELIDCLGTRDADVSQVALPSRLTDRAVELAHEGQLTVGHGGGDRGRRNRLERPRIALDPWGRGVEVILPSVGEASEGSAVWEIVADGVAATVHSRTVWAGVAEAAPETNFTIGRPTRTVVVSLLGAPRQSEFQLINADAPWLTFSSTGRLIPSHAALPPDPIWVLHPDNEQVETDKPLLVIEEGRVPSGWSGWRLALISLADATWLQLTNNPTSRRAVRGFTRPRIETGPPVDGIDTPYGSRVFAALPHVWLPSRPGTETEWRITVRTASARDVIQHRILRTTDEATVTDLWETLPRPVLGAFSITVAGPLGYGVERTVFVAEGLQSSFQPPVRILTRNGLSAASATITGPVGATAEPSRLSLTPRETAKVIEYRTAAETEPLLVRPPHLRVSYEVVDEVPHWRPRPLSLIADDLRDAPGVIAVQLPPGTVSPRAQLVVDQACVQQLIVTRSGDSVCRLHVGQLGDTLGVHPFSHLVLICGDLAMPVATIRPRRLADQVSLDGDALVLLNPAPVPRLNAAVYLTRAPWRAPLVIPAQGDRVPLPTSLADAGPLLVSLSVPDSEWVVTEQPRWPKRYQTVGGNGYLRDGSPDETALSRYLSGDGPVPETVAQPDWLWTAADLAWQLVAASRVDAVRRDCGALLAQDPAGAVASLASLGLGAERTVAALVATGFAARSTPPIDTRTARRLWSTLPAAAILLDNAFADDDLVDAARTVCGDIAMDVRKSGRDPHAGIGAFTHVAVLLSTKTSTELDVIWSAARVVPKGLLDRDSRAIAARKLFDAAIAGPESRLRNLRRIAATHLADAAQVVGTISPAHAKQISARTPVGDCQTWQLLPALSSAYAALARLASRGHPQCRDLEARVRPHFLILTETAPALVTIDLVIAELLLNDSTRLTRLSSGHGHGNLLTCPPVGQRPSTT